MDRIFYIVILVVFSIGLVCCSNTQTGIENKNTLSKEKVLDSNHLESVRDVAVDSITDDVAFFNLAPEIILPNSFNINDTFNLSDIKNGNYNGRKLPPLSSSFIKDVRILAYKRYINDAIKKHYSGEVDLLKYLAGNSPQKFYAFGKIIFKEDHLASQIIYHEVKTEKGICKFLLMVNYDTLFEVYLHSALLAVDIKSDNISLGSKLSNQETGLCVIKQKFITGNKTKDIRIEINKGFSYAPPAEGGPNPKDYIKYY